MDVIFADDELDRLEQEERLKTRLPAAVVKAYKRRMRLIHDAVDERDFPALIGPLNFKRLSGDREHQHAFRLNDQWRLIVEIQKGTPKNSIRIVAIEDYH